MKEKKKNKVALLQNVLSNYEEEYRSCPKCKGFDCHIPGCPNADKKEKK